VAAGADRHLPAALDREPHAEDDVLLGEWPQDRRGGAVGQPAVEDPVDPGLVEAGVTAQEQLSGEVGEVEIVFGLWSIVLVAAMAFMAGGAPALAYAESRNYTEPLFVFAVMVVAGSRPILSATAALLRVTARRLPVSTPVAGAWLGEIRNYEQQVLAVRA